MDRKPLFAQFDGDEVDGKRYGIGDELDGGTDAGTIAYLTGTGRFSATKPGEGSPIPDGADRPAPETMTRAEVLAELGAGESDDRLREALAMKREKLAEDAARENAPQGEGTSTDPLDGNAGPAIEYVESLSSVDDLNAAKTRETEGRNRSTVLAAIDKRIETLNAA